LDFLGSAVLAPIALREAGSAEQQALWLPRIARGDAVVGVALTEALGRARDRAGVRAEGGVLRGSALFVLEGAMADAYLVASKGALHWVDEETKGQGRRTQIAAGRPAGRRTRPRRGDVQDDQPGPHRREAGSRLSAAIREVGAGGTEDTMERRAELLGRDPVVGAAGGAVGGHRTDCCKRGLRAHR